MMMEWDVEALPRATFGRPEFPIARDSGVSSAPWCACCCPASARWFSLEWEIRWVRADDSGEFSKANWASFRYTGRHAILLRTCLVHLLGPPLLFFYLMNCVPFGRHGQPSPLAINLPRSREPLDIVVVRAGTVAVKLKKQNSISFLMWNWRR